MDSSANHDIPFPEGNDLATIPAHMEAMANQIDSELDNIAPNQITGVAAGKLLVANASGVLTPQTISGDATISNAGVLEVGAGKIDTAELKDSAVTTAKIGTGAITGPKIVDGSVSLAKTKMRAATVTVSSMANGEYGFAQHYHGLGHTNYIAMVAAEGTIFSTFEVSWKKGRLFSSEGSYEPETTILVTARNLTGSTQPAVKVSVLVVDLS